MNKILLFIFIASMSLSFSNCKRSPHNKESEVARDEYLLPGLEHGLMQSPINILSSEAKTGKHNVTLNFNGEINKVENLGHTVQLDFSPGNTISFDDKTYEFKQLHYHTPSEHLIDGITFPMEMHVVNTLMGQKKGDTPEYLVIAYLFKMGKEEEMVNAVVEQTQDVDGVKKLTCGDAFKLAGKFGVKPVEVGRICNQQKIKICKCQLGCFE